MNNIQEIAYSELSKRYRCTFQDMVSDDNIFILGKEEEPLLDVLCINGKLIIKASEELLPWCREAYGKFNGAWFSDFGNLRKLDTKLQTLGHCIEDIHHYYIPSGQSVSTEADYKVKWFNEEDILSFKDDERFDEAYAFNEESPDMLGVAALDKGEIIGMAGASRDFDKLWQIGINVTPEAQGKGIGTYLVAKLKAELLSRGIVPFYGTMESHIKSQRTAVKAGFIPTWTRLYSGRK